MKACTVLILLAGLFLCGCKKEQPSSSTTNTPTSSGNPLTAPADYGAALVRGQQVASKTVDTVSIKRAIQMFQVSEGRNPKTLQELVPDYMPKIPEPARGTKLDYNPQTGEIKVVRQ